MVLLNPCFHYLTSEGTKQGLYPDRIDLEGDGSHITQIEISPDSGNENIPPSVLAVSNLSKRQEPWLRGTWKPFTVSGNSIFGVFHVQLSSHSLALISRT
jgi:hypothetical protein